MTIPEELKKVEELIPRTSLILPEFLAVVAGHKSTLSVTFRSQSEKKLVKFHFPKLAIICNNVLISGKRVNTCIISRNKSLAEQAIKCFYDDNRKMGQLLGYPECCIEKYLQVFIPGRMNINSPIITYQSCRNTKKLNFLTNNLFNFSSRVGRKKKELTSHQQYFELNKDFPFFLQHLQFISHIPCSYGCKESIKIGEEIDSLLKEYAPNIEKIIRYTLSKPILFFNLFKLVVFDGYLKEGILYYNKLTPPYFLLENPLMEKIKKGNRIIVGDKEIRIFKDNLSLFTYKKKNEADGFILDFGE